MNKWMILLLCAGLSAQPSKSLEIIRSTHSVKTAEMLERRGDIAGAIAIYEDVLRRHSKNTIAFRKLKTLYKQEQSYDKLVSLIQNQLVLFPNDLQSHVELAEAYYIQNDLETALAIWREFAQNFSTNPTAYTVLFHSLSRYSQEDEMISLVQQGRTQFNNPTLLSLELAHYYSARKNYKGAVEEYLKYADQNQKRIKIVTDRILRLSDSEDSHNVIITTLKEAQDKPSDLDVILSSLYFKIGDYDKAYQEHLLQGLTTENDVSRWLSFADNLRREHQYALSLNAYRHVMKAPPTLLHTKLKGQALLGLGQTFEDQILPQNSTESLVAFFPDNVLFKQDFLRTTALSSSLLQTTFHMYDSVLVTLPSSSFSSTAYFRIGEIKYRITQDYDGAEQSFRKALRFRRNTAQRNQIHLRLADIYMTKGNTPAAIDYLNSVPGTDQNRQLKIIQGYFLMGELDTTQTLITEALTAIPPKHVLFNDLMEVQDLLQQHYFNGSLLDKSAFQRFVLAENQLVQNKLTEALETLKSIRTEFDGATIIPLSILREALVRQLFRQTTHALDLAEQLTSTELADYGWTLQGVVIENLMNNPELAMDFYQVVLEDYPLSLLAEPVRYHMRHLMKDTHP